MRITLEINRIKDGRTFFRAFGDTDTDAVGQGWTVIDAVDDFVSQVQRYSFYDDDTVIPVTREQMEIRERIFSVLL